MITHTKKTVADKSSRRVNRYLCMETWWRNVYCYDRLNCWRVFCCTFCCGTEKQLNDQLGQPKYHILNHDYLLLYTKCYPWPFTAGWITTGGSIDHQDWTAAVFRPHRSFIHRLHLIVFDGSRCLVGFLHIPSRPPTTSIRHWTLTTDTRLCLNHNTPIRKTTSKHGKKSDVPLTNISQPNSR